MTAALHLIRLLRKLPHSSGYDTHLTDCAAMETVYRVSNPALPPLSIAHVLRLIPLPRFNIAGPYVVHQGINIPEFGNDFFRGGINEETLDTAKLLKFEKARR